MSSLPLPQPLPNLENVDTCIWWLTICQGSRHPLFLCSVTPFQEWVMPMLSSRSIMVSDPILVFNPFWIYFCKWCVNVVQFDSFACRKQENRCPIFPTPIIEQALFSPLWILGFLCYRLITYMSVGSFLGCLFCSIGLCICFCASTL